MTLLTAGNLPLVLSSSVSPPGRHSVRILTSNGHEDTVPYTIPAVSSDGEQASNFCIFSLSYDYDHCGSSSNL